MKVRKTPDRRILGDVGNLRSEPISPTANLRLLTNLASSLKTSPTSTSRLSPNPRLCSNESAQLLETPRRLGSQPRREKSLGLLCNKFLNLYPLIQSPNIRKEISLDKTASLLGTEKRRIYDIINILESLEMATKVGKNQYLWHGQTFLPTTLVKLKSLAMKLGVQQYIQHIQRITGAYISDSTMICPPSSSTTPSYNFADCFANNEAKGDKSLGIMCQKFLMLFLTSIQNGIVNLDMAVNFLVHDSDTDEEKSDKCLKFNIKTKVRRLYDIANVLAAIGLIKKVNIRDSNIKKPVFMYTGPDVDNIDPSTVTETPISDNNRHTLIGMSTPKNKAFSFCAPSSCDDQKTTTTPRYSTTSSDDMDSDHKKLVFRKKKLFLSSDKKQQGRFLDNSIHSHNSNTEEEDSILFTAKRELEKLKSNEGDGIGVRKKLFSVHCSDATSSTSEDSNEISSVQMESESLASILLPNKICICTSETSTNCARCLKIGDNIHKTNEFECSKLNSTNSEVSTIEIGKQKLKKSDELKISLAPFQQILIKNESSSNTCFIILPDTATEVNFPVDKFKAEKVENIIQLVPSDVKSTDS